MAKIKLLKDSKEIYFKSVTEYELEVGGKPLMIHLVEDSNEGEVYYKHEDNTWTVNQPDWILEIGENDWGESIFEQTLWENLSGMIVDDEIYTHEDDEL
jgi:hypothetical protein